MLLIACSLPTVASVYADAATGEKLSLSSVIEEALKNYPEIVALSAKVSQAEARRGAGPFLPPPMLSVSRMGERSLVGNLMESSIEFSQVVPFPTKLIAESHQREAEQRAVEEELRSRSLGVRVDAKAAFIELYRAREQITLQEEKRRVFETHARRIGSLTLSDRMTQTHQIRIQTEIELARNDLEIARQEEKVAQGELNVVMGRDPESPIPDLEVPSLTEFPKSLIESASESKLAEHPQLRSLHATAEALDASLSRAKSNWLPDFFLRYRYNWRFDGVMPNNAEMMVGVDLPFLFFWQPKGRVAEARAQLEEVQAQSHQSENSLRLRLLKARSQAVRFHAQVESFTHQILPQARKRMKIAHSITPTDMESLNEHLESMQSWVSLQLAALVARVEYEKAVAMLESLTQGWEKNR